ncbi:unnamed protein product [Tilletia controversa]|uniref:Protein BNI4 n=1 Tax=Tilletia controversa TaxID=13291 RepID=A0A8X7MSI7_9BASI|nr:hypothetical protein CF328_g4286 [Tilletia controversa]KAE8246547.1 hypothetical protein A4X06_0g4972 [Tilletia controversa]CAD6915591.1 unnamed protein product [Tilletia controversa]CAD6948013.1 unnamed protein product [Tilletia controversa]
MAVSLALNWSPPASTSLFDDVSGAGDSAAAAPTTTSSSSPNGDAGTSRSNGSALTSGRRPSAPASSTGAKATSSTSNLAPSSLGVTAPSRSMSASPKPTNPSKSYAAAAASLASSPSVSSLSSTSSPIDGSAPAFGHASIEGAQSHDSEPAVSKAQIGQSIHFPTATANTYTWQQYQQMVSQARQTSTAADSTGSNVGGPRRRTTSGPQRAPASFQDAHQANPLPPLSYAPNSVPSHMRPDGSQPAMVQSNSASAISGPGAGGYHPYRKTPRTTSNSSAVPVLPQIQFGTMLEPAATVSLSPIGLEGRTPTGSDSAPPALAPSLSYSSVAAGALRGEAASSPAAMAPPSAATTQAPEPTPTTSGNLSYESSQGRRTSDASSIASPPTGFNHLRNTSFSSQNSTSTERERPGVPAATATPLAKSPLSQQAQAGSSTAHSAAQKKSLPNRLRKALSLSTMSEFSAATENSAVPSRATGRVQRPDVGSGVAVTTEFTPQDPLNGLGSSAASISSRRSARPPIAGSSEGTSKRGIFNRKFNASTDNISISSTVSSASVMLRKMGNLGKIARRSSLMGLTNMFKDKDRNGPDGRGGLQTDDFGTMTASGAMTDGVENNAAQAAKVKAKRGKDKKAAPVAASITHATVELETGAGTMTPAASYVRQQQLQMQQLNEQAGGMATPNSPQGTSGRVRDARSKATKAAEVANSSNSAPGAQGSEDRNQKMFEKERERLKKQRGGGWKRMLGGGSSNVADASADGQIPKTANGKSAVGQEPHVAAEEEYPPGYGNAMNAAQGGSGKSRWAQGAPNAPPNALPHNAAALYGEPSHDSSYDDDGFLEPPHAPYADAGGESGDESETDSLRHWGEGIERSRASAARIKAVRSILKSTSAYGPDHTQANGHDRSAGLGGARMRSSSFDATKGLSAPGAPLMSQMSNTTAGTDRMDGLGTARADSPSNFGARSDSISRNGGGGGQGENGHVSPPLASPTAGVGATTNLGHHPNSSMPTLSLIMMDGSGGANNGKRPNAPRAAKRRLMFAESDIFHSTWPAHVYDRSGDLATCSRLTPALAQSIKEELNSFKMEEMVVAPTSRVYTHFFV